MPNEKLDEIVVECRAAKLGCVDCKKMLSEALLANLAPIQERRHYYENHPEEVKEILMAGNARARATARQTLAEVREAVAFNLDFQRWT